MMYPALKIPVFRLVRITGLLLTALLLPVKATTLASCNPTFTVCLIPEEVLLQLPFDAIAGDVVLTDPIGHVSDVFRIFNNFINTGAGTGLGTQAELYSADDGPVPTTYSANVVFIPESPTGVTTYTNNGVSYLLGVPEPETTGLLTLAGGLLYAFVRKRARTTGGGCDAPDLLNS
jgi:hypothetical protein